MKTITMFWKILLPAVCVLLGATGLPRPGLASDAPPQLGAKLVYAEELQGKADKLWPDPRLKQAFEQYWHYRSAGAAKEAFRLEAPFFQEMVTENKYLKLFKGAANTQLLSMRIQGLERRSEHLYVIRCTKKFKDSGGKVRQSHHADEWVFAGERWYHVLKDQAFFPEAL